jgi:L-alanine-DL-glutamate epimerase-like enolase superfamily enzyme
MPMQGGLPTGEATTDRITRVTISLTLLPLSNPISDAKVLTGRQKPLTEVAMLFAEIESANGNTGIGLSYSKRAGGPALYAHAKEIADNLLGEDPNDIARLWVKLQWAGASVGRSGLAVQAIAAFDVALWDMKAKRADLPLAKLLGAHRDPCSATTPRAGSSRRRPSRCWRTSTPRWPRGSAASRSRSASLIR